jgi:hypothetical protein
MMFSASEYRATPSLPMTRKLPLRPSAPAERRQRPGRNPVVAVLMPANKHFLAFRRVISSS